MVKFLCLFLLEINVTRPTPVPKVFGAVMSPPPALDTVSTGTVSPKTFPKRPVRYDLCTGKGD